MEYKAKVVAARERKFPCRNFEPLSKRVKRAYSPQTFRNTTSYGGNFGVFPDSSPVCRTDTPTSPSCPCCYSVNLDVPVFDPASGWMEKDLWLSFELACKSEVVNGDLQQWRSVLPIKGMMSGYNSRYDINEGPRNDFTQDYHEDPPVSNGCSSGHKMNEGKRDDFTRDDYEEPPVPNGYFGNADLTSPRIQSADMVIRHELPNASQDRLV